MSRVPVLPQAAALLEKYRADANCRARGKLLPVPSNTKMNAYLEEIADICQIHKHLTTHLRAIRSQRWRLIRDAD